MSRPIYETDAISFSECRFLVLLKFGAEAELIGIESIVLQSRIVQGSEYPPGVEREYVDRQEAAVRPTVRSWQAMAHFRLLR